MAIVLFFFCLVSIMVTLALFCWSPQRWLVVAFPLMALIMIALMASIAAP